MSDFELRFVPGLELNEGFYKDIISPLLAGRFGGVPYSAALLGYGSDVLGYDTAVSMDHNWGPRLQIFLTAEDLNAHGSRMSECFNYNLPFEYAGFSTNYCPPRYDRTQSMEENRSYPIRHLIEIATPGSYFEGYLGVDPTRALSHDAWMSFSDQKLLEVTSGRIFHDGLPNRAGGALAELRKRLEFFPRRVLLLRLAKLWRAIGEEEPLVGRTVDLGTPGGTKILAARLVETCIRICMYLERRYPPYRKWLYRAFETTRAYSEMHPLCMAVLLENDPSKIEDRLCVLYEKVVQLHNAHGELPSLDNHTRTFFNRPYKVIFAETIVARLEEAAAETGAR